MNFKPKKKIIFNNPNINNIKKYKYLDNVILQVLGNRGYDTDDKIDVFFDYSIEKLHDPSLLKDGKLGASLIVEAIKNNEQIVIYTDYDSDGCNGAAVALLALRKLGAKVDVFLNNRFIDGYGMVVKGVDNLLEAFPETKLIVTIDNGISAFEAIDYAINKGLKVVVTDHHETKDTIPNAHAVINPKRHDDTYPFKGLCGAVVIFKVMELVYREMNVDSEYLYTLLDILAVATVGDIVPLVDENRIIVKNGIEMIKNGSREVFNIINDIKSITEINAHYTIGFIYVPMINALSRMEGYPLLAINMYLEEDTDKIVEAVNVLDKANEERQALTKEQEELALNLLEEKGIKDVIVLWNENFHEGVIGLIAGRLKERYNRPVFIFAKNEDGIYKGSARSINNYHIKEVLDEVQERDNILLGYGGHAMAAGLSILEENLQMLEETLLIISFERLSEEDYHKKINVDSVIDALDINEEIIEQISHLEPFGESFPKPIFGLKNFIVPSLSSISYMGKDKNHLKIKGETMTLIRWRDDDKKYDSIGRPRVLKAIGFPSINEFNLKKEIQFIVSDDNIFRGN